jgi:hopanoid biosynthesis associated protein HpnK
MLTTQVIINADDFGRSPAVNDAVIRAHREGILTSASLMVTGDAYEQAVALAHATPTLAVGLHLVVGSGQAVLSHKEIPHLVDVNGRLSNNPLRTGLYYWFSRAAQSELARELAAQFERFAATGLPLSHVDGHLHLHIHPKVFNLLLPLADVYGSSGLRLPRDELKLALRHDRRQAIAKITWAVSLGLVCAWCQRLLSNHRMAIPRQVYGVMQTGQMREAYVLEVLRCLQVPTAELYFHPSTSAQTEALGPNPGDLETLLSSAVRQVIVERGLHLATYSTLEMVR